jgi:hypothetical protein
MSPTAQSSLEHLAKLLLDEERLRILGMAALQPCTADTLAETLAGKRSDLTRHLTQLLDAELLSVEGEPGREQYRLNVAAIQRLKRTLFARPEAQPATAEEKVLSAFVHDGALTHLPANYSKRLIVLAWLAEEFDPGQAYSEAEVNEVLGRHGEDPATLRRYLVDNGFLERGGGIYRRAQ